MFIPALLIGGLLLMAGGGGKKRRRPTPTPGPTPEPGPAREPTAEEAEAIMYCEMEGGEASVMETPDGESYFICIFPDGRMVEAGAFHRGEAFPECPVEMVYDPETETCVLAGEVPSCPEGSTWDEVEGACVIIGEAWPPSPDDPNFQMCMGGLLAAWARYTDVYYNLAPAVAQNTYQLMRQAAEEAWAGYSNYEALADFGMVHVVPQCDWYAMREYVKDYINEVGIGPGSPDDLERAEEVYESVVALAKEVIADVGVKEPAFQPTSDPGLNPDQGGIYPKCPTSYFYDALHEVCCPEGFYWNVEDQLCRPLGYGGQRHIAGRHKKPQGDTKAHRVDMIRNGFAGRAFAGGCGGRRGHCGVRAR